MGIRRLKDIQSKKDITRMIVMKKTKNPQKTDILMMRTIQKIVVNMMVKTRISIVEVNLMCILKKRNMMINMKVKSIMIMDLINPIKLRKMAAIVLDHEIVDDEMCSIFTNFYIVQELVL